MKAAGAGSFQAIVWKELRENLAWAALGLTLTFVGLISGLPSATSQDSPDLIFLFSMTVYVALIGLMFGLAQVRAERRGDKWSFLMHRPVPRSTLFWGKTFAGLLMCTSAVGIPVFSVALWLTLPGHVAAPFSWRMTLPAVADLMCGFVFYFAGMLTAMREARWYATRTMGVGVGIICAMAIQTQIHTFGMAAAFCGTGILTTCIAARGTFIAGGPYATQSRISRVSVGVAIASGLGVVGVVTLALVMTFIPSKSHPSPLISFRYALSGDGEIVQTAAGNRGDQINDIHGDPIEKYKDDAARRTFDAGVLRAEASIDPDGRRTLSPPSVSGYRSSFDIYSPLVPERGAFHWYYIHDLGLIAGYSTTSKRLIGCLGPDGYTDGEALPNNRFHGEAQSYWHGESLIAFSDAVYRIDLAGRQVAKVFTAPAGERISGAGDYISSDESTPSSDTSTRFVVIATTQKVYVQSSDGTLKLAVPRDPQAAGYAFVEFFQASKAPGAPTFLWYLPEGGSKFTLSEALGMPVQVTQIDSAGAVLAHLTLPRPGVHIVSSDITAGTLAVPLLLRPVLDLATDRKLFPLSVNPGRMFTGWLWPVLLGCAIAGFIFAWGRRYAFAPGQLLLWTALGFGLGPLGLTLMFALLQWPAKEKCSTCGRLRVVTREHCEHCNAAFPAPSPDGTEIFETADV